ncbi:hypothetical protein RCL1_007843 [Eukaryota sp. TZLM3-RCL]
MVNVDDLNRPSQLKSIIVKMISTDPRSRPSINQIRDCFGQISHHNCISQLDSTNVSNNSIVIPDGMSTVIEKEQDATDSINFRINNFDDDESIRFSLITIKDFAIYKSFFGFIQDDESKVYTGFFIDESGVFEVRNGEKTIQLGPPLYPNYVVVVDFSSDLVVFRCPNANTLGTILPDDGVFFQTSNNGFIWSRDVVLFSEANVEKFKGKTNGYVLHTRLFHVLVSLSIAFMVLLLLGNV